MGTIKADHKNLVLMTQYEALSFEIDSVILSTCKQYDDICPDPSVAWFMDITFHPTMLSNDDPNVITTLENRGTQQISGYSVEVSLLLESIETLFEYIKLFRGSLALYKTNKLSDQIRYIFNADVSNVYRSRLIKNALIDWILWMNHYSTSEDRVVRECIDYMKALSVILDNDKNKNEPC